jgi:hypothetical protein
VVCNRRRNFSEHTNQLELDFDAAVASAEVFGRDRIDSASTESSTYDPVEQTANYMRHVVEAEANWETTLERARGALLNADPRELYFEFLVDLARQIESGSSRSATLTDLLEQVGHRGLGIGRQTLNIVRPSVGGNRIRVILDKASLRVHLSSHVVGEHFLNLLTPATDAWGIQGPVIGGSDVSQHRSSIPVPAKYFKRSVPFVLNNAAGTRFQFLNGEPQWENVFNPRPDDQLLRWMLIDPSYQDELEPEDYNRCLASAMDIGQYKFDFDYLMKNGLRTPNVIFRDGSLFPQDAYLDNFIIEGKRGDFTREAIRDFLACLSYARVAKSLYCGISKRVQLKVYSAIIDWFIAREIDSSWSFGPYTLNDGQALSLLLASSTFVDPGLKQVLSTCLIRRSFTTRAALNTRTSLSSLDVYFEKYEAGHPTVNIQDYRSLCSIAHLFMFFMGHSKSPQAQLPRYEFFQVEQLEQPWQTASKILAALGYCGLMNDNDHSFMAEEPITYLIPSVTQQAHTLSKDVGRAIDRATGQWIMARYQRYLGR